MLTRRKVFQLPSGTTKWSLAPAGSFADLIGQARDAADDAQGELDRLRDILDALERTQDE